MPKSFFAFTRIRGLQSLGLQLLAQREKNELDLCSRELEIEKMKVRHEERRLALDERRLALDEEKHRFEVERWRGERESLLDEIKKCLMNKPPNWRSTTTHKTTPPQHVSRETSPVGSHFLHVNSNTTLFKIQWFRLEDA